MDANIVFEASLKGKRGIVGRVRRLCCLGPSARRRDGASDRRPENNDGGEESEFEHSAPP